MANIYRFRNQSVAFENTITSTLSSGTNLTIANSSSSSGIPLTVFQGSLTTSAKTQLKLGVAAATNNTGILQFNYSGNASASNSLGIGLEGSENLLQISGTTISSVLPITNTISTGTNLTLTNNASSSQAVLKVYQPNLANAGIISRELGVNTSNFNFATQRFVYTSTGSVLNYIGIGLKSVEDVIVVNGNQRVGINNTAPSFTLDVTGTIRATGLISANLGLTVTGATTSVTSLTASGSINGSSVTLTGSTSGVITIQPQAVAGTYNFNMPTTAGTSGQILTSQGGGATAMIWTTAGTGTVTSVGLSVPAFLSISGSPITTSGTLAVTLSGTALPVLNGGTGTTTSTGSGSVVLSTSPSLTTPSLGAATCTTLTASAGLTNSNNTNGIGTTITNLNSNTGSGAFSLMSVQNSAGSCVWYINSTTRSSDGVASGATLRNDIGELRLQGNAGTSTILLSGGLITTTALTASGLITASAGLTSTAGTTTLGTTTVTNSSGTLLALSSTNSAGDINTFTSLTGSLPNGARNNMTVGKAFSTNDSATYRYFYTSVGSTSNYTTIGFYGNDDILTVQATKRVGINNTAPLFPLSIYYSNSNTSSTTFKNNIGFEIYNQYSGSTASIFETNNLLGFTDSNSTQAAIGAYRKNIRDNYLSGIQFLVNQASVSGRPTSNDTASSSLTEAMRITPEGYVGIGTSSPNALLQLSNSVVNRKIVLYDSNNNDHQYFGLGINNATLRYQVDSTVNAHVFYAGTSSTTSNELLRISGNGKVGINNTAPSVALDVSGSNYTLNSIVVGGSLRFPPTALTGNSTTITGQTYGNGTYITTASSIFSGSEDVWKAFDYQTTSEIWSSSGSRYNASSGAYTGSNTTTIDSVSYSGEWIQIQLPVTTQLFRYEIYPRSASLARAPNIFYLAGSIDGSTWTMVDSRTGQSGYTTSGKQFTVTFNVLHNGFLYYRLVTNAINTSNDGLASIAEWILYANNNTVGTSTSLSPETKTLIQSGSIAITNTLGTALTVGASTQQYSTAIYITESAHATSRRTGIAFGNTAGTTGWQIVQDLQGNGTRDFALYDNTAALTRFCIGTTGNIGIGNTAPTFTLDVTGNARVQRDAGNSTAVTVSNLDIQNTNSGTSAGAFMRFLPQSQTTNYWNIGSEGSATSNAFHVYNQATTGVYMLSGSTAWTGNSDFRIKRNIVDITDGLNVVLQLEPVTYNFISDDANYKKRGGFIAQNVQQVLPDIVSSQVTEEFPDGLLGISMTEMIPYIVKSIHNLNSKIQAQQNIIDILTNFIKEKFNDFPL